MFVIMENFATFCFSSFLEYIYINVMGHEPHTLTHTHMCVCVCVYTGTILLSKLAT